MLIYEIVGYKCDWDLFPYAMATTKYSIVKEQVTMRAILQLFLSFNFGRRKSLKVSL